MSNPAIPTPPAGAVISGAGLAVPSNVRSNADMEKLVDTNDEWIVQRTGITQRYVSVNGEMTSDLAAKAVTAALEDAKLDPGKLDLLICATMTPDMVCPATACQIVDKIGAVPCGAMDLNLACTGFVAALNTAANFIASGQYRHIAVVGAEQLSKIVDWTDRRTCVLFGDGAGAAIISATDDKTRGCIYQEMHSDGSRWKELYVPRCDQQIPDPEVFNGTADTLQMNGQEVYKFAVTTLIRSIKNAMKKCGIGPDDVAMVIPHQSNMRILENARKKLGFADGKIYMNLPRFGNTSAASVGICLAEIRQQGLIKPGDTVIFVGLGGGLTWATSVWKY